MSKPLNVEALLTRLRLTLDKKRKLTARDVREVERLANLCEQLCTATSQEQVGSVVAMVAHMDEQIGAIIRDIPAIVTRAVVEAIGKKDEA